MNFDLFEVRSVLFLPASNPRAIAKARESDADLVIFNPEAQQVISAKTHHMKVDYNPYEGRPVRGAAETVLSRGRGRRSSTWSISA